MSLRSVHVKSPGRINIIGEHTDYNDGFVLPAAIDKGIFFHLQLNGTDSQVNIHASNLEEDFSFNLSSFDPIKSGWQNYVMGVVKELQILGGEIKGFDGRFEGNVPIGSGMSSSAALECSLAFGLNELFNLKLDKWQLIRASQMAEHHFVGTKCGIMDQFASVMGKEGKVMLLDCRSLEFEYFPLELGSYRLFLLNTNVSHSLATSEYNTRREECEAGVTVLQSRFPALHSLRDAGLDQLNSCREFMDEKIFRRCRHVISENNRVALATETLKSRDIIKLGSLMSASHFSLQKDYEVSCQELDFLVSKTADKVYIPGARMMGGGFGGCIIGIIAQERYDEFMEEVSVAYIEEFGIAPTPYTVSIAGGTHLVL